MNCKRIFLSLFVCLTINSYSQQEDATNVAKFTLLNPGLSFEFRIAKFQTIYSQFFINTSANVQGDDFGTSNIDFYFDPAATLQYRYYYNGNKLLEKGKDISMNSMNYVTLVGETVFSKIPLKSSSLEEAKRRPLTRIGAAWGIQRNLPKHFSIDFYIGGGILLSKETTYNASLQKLELNISQPTLITQLNIGFWFAGKK